MVSLVQSRTPDQPIMTKDQINQLIEEKNYEGIILADGFEDAFLGIAKQFNESFAVYDREKCIDILTKDMSIDEADEYFEFNVQGAYVGESTPAFVDVLNFNKELDKQS